MAVLGKQVSSSATGLVHGIVPPLKHSLTLNRIFPWRISFFWLKEWILSILFYFITEASLSWSCTYLLCSVNVQIWPEAVKSATAKIGHPRSQQWVIVPAECPPFIYWMKRQVWESYEHQLPTEWVRKSPLISDVSALVLKTKLSVYVLGVYLKNQAVTLSSCRNTSAFGVQN